MCHLLYTCKSICDYKHISYAYKIYASMFIMHDVLDLCILYCIYHTLIFTFYDGEKFQSIRCGSQRSKFWLDQLFIMISQDSRGDYSHNLMIFSLVRDLELLVRIAAIAGFVVTVLELVMQLLVSDFVLASGHESYMYLFKEHCDKSLL